MKIVAHFGSTQDKAGMAVLENWKLFNPISDFRVQLAAIYLKHAQGLVAKVRSLTEDQVRSWLDGMALPPATAAGSDVKGFLLASMVSGSGHFGRSREGQTAYVLSEYELVLGKRIESDVG